MGFRERMTRFMYGRYGMDNLNQWISYLVLGLIIINIFVRSGLISSLELILLIICIFRMLSKNTAQRSRENAKFYQVRGKITGWFRREKNVMSQRKDYHIYKCPQCKQKIRIPRGKGKICVTCPKCRTEFIKKS